MKAQATACPHLSGESAVAQGWKSDAKNDEFEHCVLSRSVKPCKQIFLSLYAGTGKVASVFNKSNKSTTTIEIDVIEDGRNDLTRVKLQKAIERQITPRFRDYVEVDSGTAYDLPPPPGLTDDETDSEPQHVIGIDLPCNTWTVCRSGGGGPRPLRKLVLFCLGFLGWVMEIAWRWRSVTFSIDTRSA
jgi:hypothetical protein